ncbi:adenosine receptor A2b-like [Oculina patagonica]
MENSTVNEPSVGPLITNINCLHLEEEWITATESFVCNVILIVVNSLTSLTATIGNMLILMAVSRTPALRTPSNTLLCCLAFADLLVGLVVQPTYTLQMVFEIQRNLQAFCIAKIITTGSLSWICAGVSFLVISAISVERLLAIKLHLRYKALVTISRILIVVVGFWILCTTLTIARFLGASYKTLVLIVVAMDVSCIITTVVSYLKIYLRVRKLQNKTRDQRHLAPPGMNINSFKRSAVTMLYIMALFLACYIPFLATLVVKMRQGGSLPLNIIYNFAASIVYINSSLNPFVYCFRCKDVRIAVFKLLGRKYTIDMKGDVVPVFSSTQKINSLKNSILFQPSPSLHRSVDTQL